MSASSPHTTGDSTSQPDVLAEQRWFLDRDVVEQRIEEPIAHRGRKVLNTERSTVPTTSGPRHLQSDIARCAVRGKGPGLLSPRLTARASSAT